ncbi:MAG: glycosyltransferase family 1 protein [Patescibacteria group bacterium]|jgi:glycosyltransferase involved in cell wall biosynthesis
MKIGIDCRTILNTKGGELAGVGHYTYFLVKNILAIDHENQYVLFFDNRFTNFKEFEQENVTIKTFPFYQYKKYLPIAYSQMLISSFLNREKLDLLHCPANVIPLFYNGTTILTVHDLAIYKYPEFFPKKFLSRQVFSTKILVPKSLIKAAKIIAVSKSTKSDIVENFGIPEEKIEVVYEGLDSHEIAKSIHTDFNKTKLKYGISRNYFLYVGTIEPRKNLVRLIRAFRNLRMVYDSPATDFQLILAGAKGWSDKEVYQAISNANASILGIDKKRSGEERRSGLDTRSEEQRKREGERRKFIERRQHNPIKYLGYVSSEEKYALMKNSFAFTFPSLYEGFGLPVLEAIGMGVPVITSNISSLPELVGKECGILVNPEDESEITDALSQIITDDGLRELFSVNCKERIKNMDWSNCAEATLEAYLSLKK